NSYRGSLFPTVPALSGCEGPIVGATSRRLLSMERRSLLPRGRSGFFCAVEQPHSPSLFSPRPAPFQLKGTHLPLDHLRTPARLSRGRTIFFASGVVAVCGSARSPAHAGGT